MLKPNIDFKAMIQQADDAVQTMTPTEVSKQLGASDVLLVDIRDVRELEREGRIPDSKHIPRGMLEFWVHPDSPYFKPYFESAKTIILYCNRGWRSALAAKALKDIGIEAAHMAGGYAGWVQDNLPTEHYVRRQP